MGKCNALYHRRSVQLLVNCNSPLSRFSNNNDSVSLTSSLELRDSSTYPSYELSIASSLMSHKCDRLSPSAPAPVAEAELDTDSSCAANKSLKLSPKASLSGAPFQRMTSGNEPLRKRKVSVPSTAHSRQTNIPKAQGALVCECCPKKAKKFDNEHELWLHEMKRQYTCQHCPNRFKTKNEAKRHQNLEPSPEVGVASVASYNGVVNGWINGPSPLRDSGIMHDAHKHF
ncbi:hypothetical protein B0A49_13720 [Cryomyces minteri]|uniref:C2H2-type zinc finger ascomycetes domain-containing protein n=1 Tax=Cryomyces minteri TaxID=331657 RepID=A0A4V5NCB6_9PEZI|nr:hypothetical protein B0A49_13720 [Cryomyces minteri]